MPANAGIQRKRGHYTDVGSAPSRARSDSAAASWKLALSGSTNTGIPFAPGVFVSLDPDAIFNLTFPVPDPNFFVAFQGTVSPGGIVFAALVVPPLFIGCFPINAQAGVIDAGGNVMLSNVQSFTIT